MSDDDDHEIRMLWCLSFIFTFEKKKSRNDETVGRSMCKENYQLRHKFCGKKFCFQKPFTMNSAKVYALILARIFGVYYCFYFYNGDLGMFLTDFHAFLKFVNIIDK